MGLEGFVIELPEKVANALTEELVDICLTLEPVARESETAQVAQQRIVNIVARIRTKVA